MGYLLQKSTSTARGPAYPHAYPSEPELPVPLPVPEAPSPEGLEGFAAGALDGLLTLLESELAGGLVFL